MIKVGIIGAGRIGRVHAESLYYHVKTAQITAVSDPAMAPDMKEWLAERNIEAFAGYNEIINDPRIDAVMVCSPTKTHTEIAIAAIKAGKHVFCEKPISADISEIKAVMSELEKTPVLFQVGFNRRYDHNFKAVREAVAAGRIGEPHIVKITSRDPNPPSLDYVKVSGGLFLDMAIHDFDMARFLTGSEVEEVFACGAVLVDPEIGKAGDIDTAVTTLKFASGALAVIDNSRRAEYGYDQRAEVFGSKGLVSISNDTPSSAVISGKDGVTGEKPLYFFLERYMNSFTDEVTDFINAIEKGTPPAVLAYDGLQAVLIAKAAGKSLNENRPVKLSEIGV